MAIMLAAIVGLLAAPVYLAGPADVVEVPPAATLLSGATGCTVTIEIILDVVLEAPAANELGYSAGGAETPPLGTPVLETPAATELWYPTGGAATTLIGAARGVETLLSICAVFTMVAEPLSVGPARGAETLVSMCAVASVKLVEALLVGTATGVDILVPTTGYAVVGTEGAVVETPGASSGALTLDSM